MISTLQRDLGTQLLEACDGRREAALAALDRAIIDAVVAAHPAPSNLGAPIITTTELRKTYSVGGQQVRALDGVDVTIHQGEFVALTGTSGSGKSTLLQAIGGLDQPTSGRIVVDGHDISKLSDGKLSRFRNQTVGFIFQFFYLQPFLDLQTNIEVPAMFARTKHKSRIARSRELAQIVGLAERMRHLPRELSGGQMQRVAIARALMNSPRILLADEPTGNLDRANALAIFELFRSICAESGMTIVIVTHDQDLALHADRVISMADGKVIA